MKKRTCSFLILRVLLLLLSISFTLSACLSQETTSPDEDQSPRYLAAIPEKNIFLYPVSEKEDPEVKKEWLHPAGMILNVDGVDFIFDEWMHPSRDDPPKMAFIEEDRFLTISYLCGVGTGIHNEAIHILDAANGFAEIPIDDPVQTVRQQLKQTLVPGGVLASIGDMELSAAARWEEDEYLESVGDTFMYIIDKDVITADVYLGFHSSVFVYEGAVHIDYGYDETSNRFIPKNIYFIDKESLEHYRDDD